jgi:hypothetical protein
LTASPATGISGLDPAIFAFTVTVTTTTPNIYVTNLGANNVKIFTSTGAVSPIAGGTISDLSPFGIAVH